MTIEQFCTKHHACKEGKEWALASCASMKEVWEKTTPEWLIWVATRPSVLTGKELRLFAVFCARQVQHLMTDPRSIEAIDVAEKHAQGKASDDELAVADATARAAYAAACAAADTASDAAYAAARAVADAAYAAARAGALAAARAAILSAILAAGAAAGAAMKESHATWLRENTTPNFL